MPEVEASSNPEKIPEPVSETEKIFNPEIVEGSQEDSSSQKTEPTLGPDLRDGIYRTIAGAENEAFGPQSQELLRPEALIDRLANQTLEQFEKHERIKRYGEGRLGILRAFLAGESDYNLDQKENVRHNAWKEIGRRGLQSLLNKRVMVAGGMAVLAGVLTGGVGSAAAGVIFGSMVGRAAAESASMFNGRYGKARVEMVLAERAHFNKMHEIALALQTGLKNQESQESLSLEERYDLTLKLVDMYHKLSSEGPVMQRYKLAEESLSATQAQEARWQKWGQTIGELCGAAGGLAFDFMRGRFAPIDLDFGNKVDGEAIVHSISRENGIWQWANSQNTSFLGSHGMLGQDASFIRVTGGLVGEHVSDMAILGNATWQHALPPLLATFAIGVKDKFKPQASEIDQADERVKAQAMKEYAIAPKEYIERRRAYYQDMVNKNINFESSFGTGKLPEDGEDSWFQYDESKPNHDRLTNQTKIEKVDWLNDRIYYSFKDPNSEQDIFVPVSSTIDQFLKSHRFRKIEASGSESSKKEEKTQGAEKPMKADMPENQVDQGDSVVEKRIESIEDIGKELLGRTIEVSYYKNPNTKQNQKYHCFFNKFNYTKNNQDYIFDIRASDNFRDYFEEDSKEYSKDQPKKIKVRVVKYEKQKSIRNNRIMNVLYIEPEKLPTANINE